MSKRTKYPQWLPLKDAATYAHVRPATMRRYCQGGTDYFGMMHVRAEKRKGEWFIDKCSIDKVYARQEKHYHAVLRRGYHYLGWVHYGGTAPHGANFRLAYHAGWHCFALPALQEQEESHEYYV